MTIRLDNVAFSYDAKRVALDVPLLEIDAGLTVIVGPNGAGKSTLLRLIAGIEAPARGTVSIDGCDLWRNEVEARQQLAFVPENPELTPYATVLDTLRLVASLRGAPLSTVVDALDRVGLFEASGRTVRELSMGQRRRAMLATALVATPRVIVLDEPLETLDAAMRVFVRDWVFELRERGSTVLVATHDFASFAPNVDRALAVRDGRVERHDFPAEWSDAERLERLSALVAQGVR